MHAIGQALYEQVVYDEDGQLVTGTFVDYALPTAAEVPAIETDRTETPVAGQLARREGDRRGGHDRRDAGRGGRGARRARPLGVTELDMPLTPMRVWQAIQEGGARHDHRTLRLRGARELEEAVRMLHENGEDAKLLAGGHSLLPLMKLRLAAPTCWSTCAGSPACTASSARTAAGGSGR